MDKRGFVRVDELKELIRKETVLVSVMAVNNEVGSIQPIQEISDLLDDFPKIHFHVDAVQAIGKVPFSQWLTERVDFATFSAHKFHGPRELVSFIGKRVVVSTITDRWRARKKSAKWDRKCSRYCGYG